MIRQVLGFLFTEDKLGVVLIHKRNPEWQRGMWNGVGGKMEELEGPWEAMVREFKEETGLFIDSWKPEFTLKAPENVVFVFSAFSDLAKKMVTTTAEAVELQRVIHIPGRVDVLPNLNYLIPMCLYSDHLKGTVINYPS